MLQYGPIAEDELVQWLAKAMKICQNRQYVTTNPLQIHYPLLPTDCSALSISPNMLSVGHQQVRTQYHSNDAISARDFRGIKYDSKAAKSTSLAWSNYWCNYLGGLLDINSWQGFARANIRGQCESMLAMTVGSMEIVIEGPRLFDRDLIQLIRSSAEDLLAGFTAL